MLSLNEYELPALSLSLEPHRRYASSESLRELRENLELYHECDNSVDRHVTIFGGSDAALEFLLRDKCVLAFTPTYSYVESLASELVGIKHFPGAVIKKPADLLLRKWETMRRFVQVIYICNPNNPTGLLWDNADIIKVALAVGDVDVVVDEAYQDFSDQPSLANINAPLLPNIHVVRTFSKAYGLAGARVGYIVSESPHLQSAHPCSPEAIRAANLVLENIDFYKKARVADTLRIKASFVNRLSRVPNCIVIDGPVNWVVVNCKPEKFGRDMAVYGFPGWSRITIGTSSQMDDVFDAMVLTRPIPFAKYLQPEKRQRLHNLLKLVAMQLKQLCINFWLDSGSLLGAVKYGDIIDWDDDIDLAFVDVDEGKSVQLLEGCSSFDIRPSTNNGNKYYQVFEDETATKDDPHIDLFPFVCDDDGKLVNRDARFRTHDDSMCNFVYNLDDVRQPLAKIPFGSENMPCPARLPPNMNLYDIYVKGCDPIKCKLPLECELSIIPPDVESKWLAEVSTVHDNIRQKLRFCDRWQTIVFDLDETLFRSIPSATGDLVLPGTYEILSYCDRRKLNVCFVTARPRSRYIETMEQIKSAGYSFSYRNRRRLFLRKETENAFTFKLNAFNQIQERYVVFLVAGDQDIDVLVKAVHTVRMPKLYRGDF